jgi:hypothetical protein
MELYSKVEAPGLKLRRWWITDNFGREHIAVDTTSWSPLGKSVSFCYEAVRGITLACSARPCACVHACLRCLLLHRRLVQVRVRIDRRVMPTW